MLARGDNVRVYLADLTPRVRQVMERVAMGLTNREIADKLGTKEITVRNQLALLAYELGMQTDTKNHTRRKLIQHFFYVLPRA